MPRLAGTAPEARERLVHLVDTLNSSIALGRRIIEDLRPSTLSNLGLATTLEILGREFAEPGVQALAEAVRLDAAELMVFRLVQEAHQHHRTPRPTMSGWHWVAGGQVEVSVRDDGVGFDTGTDKSAYGLAACAFGSKRAGGTLTWLPPDRAPVRGAAPQADRRRLSRSQAVQSYVPPPRHRAVRYYRQAFERTPTVGQRAWRRQALPIQEPTMLHYAVVFFVIALIAAVFGFGGIAASAVGIAKILFVVFAILASPASSSACRRLTVRLCVGRRRKEGMAGLVHAGFYRRVST
jgi:uncharacterized membrane protein YtjA (UPF0391 family)